LVLFFFFGLKNALDILLHTFQIIVIGKMSLKIQ
jgi:hypothetical protein